METAGKKLSPRETIRKVYKKVSGLNLDSSATEVAFRQLRDLDCVSEGNSDEASASDKNCRYLNPIRNIRGDENESDAEKLRSLDLQILRLKAELLRGFEVEALLSTAQLQAKTDRSTVRTKKMEDVVTIMIERKQAIELRANQATARLISERLSLEKQILRRTVMGFVSRSISKGKKIAAERIMEVRRLEIRREERRRTAAARVIDSWKSYRFRCFYNRLRCIIYKNRELRRVAAEADEESFLERIAERLRQEDDELLAVHDKSNTELLRSVTASNRLYSSPSRPTGSPRSKPSSLRSRTSLESFPECSSRRTVFDKIPEYDVNSRPDFLSTREHIAALETQRRRQIAEEESVATERLAPFSDHIVEKFTAASTESAPDKSDDWYTRAFVTPQFRKSVKCTAEESVPLKLLQKIVNSSNEEITAQHSLPLIRRNDNGNSILLEATVGSGKPYNVPTGVSGAIRRRSVL